MKWLLLLFALSAHASDPLILEDPGSTFLPKRIIPPPNTNLYWVTLLATNVCATFFEWSWGTNGFDYPWTNYGGNVMAISNLVPRVQYRFRQTDSNCAPTVDFFVPPLQPPLTNTMVFNYTGTLLMAMSAGVPDSNLKFFTVTNRVFRLDQRTNYFWRGLGQTNELTFTMTNNQIKWKPNKQ